MSAEEIRKLAEDCHKKSWCYGLDTIEHRIEKNKEQALLSYAAMVERCKKKRADIMAQTFRHDIGWMGGDDKAVYIALGDVLRGDAGKEER